MIIIGVISPHHGDSARRRMEQAHPPPPWATYRQNGVEMSFHIGTQNERGEQRRVISTSPGLSARGSGRHARVRQALRASFCCGLGRWTAPSREGDRQLDEIDAAVGSSARTRACSQTFGNSRLLLAGPIWQPSDPCRPSPAGWASSAQACCGFCLDSAERALHPQTERVSGRIVVDPNVALRLMLGQDRADGDGVATSWRSSTSMSRCIIIC